MPKYLIWPIVAALLLSLFSCAPNGARTEAQLKSDPNYQQAKVESPGTYEVWYDPKAPSELLTFPVYEVCNCRQEQHTFTTINGTAEKEVPYKVNVQVCPQLQGQYLSTFVTAQMDNGKALSVPALLLVQGEYPDVLKLESILISTNQDGSDATRYLVQKEWQLIRVKGLLSCGYG